VRVVHGDGTGDEGDRHEEEAVEGGAEAEGREQTSQDDRESRRVALKSGRRRASAGPYIIYVYIGLGTRENQSG